MSNPLVSLLLQLPLGILFAAVLVEVFVLWKDRREVEPAVLWLLFCAVGVSLLCAGAHFLLTGTIGYAVWIAGAAALAGMGFWFKRQARNRGVLRLKDRFYAPGSYAPVSMPGQSTYIMGYRASLGFAILITLAGIYFGDVIVTSEPKPAAVAQTPAPATPANPANPDPNAPPATPAVAQTNPAAVQPAPAVDPAAPAPDPAAPAPPATDPAVAATPQTPPAAPDTPAAPPATPGTPPGTPDPAAPATPAPGTPTPVTTPAPPATPATPAPATPAPTPAIMPAADVRPISKNSIFASKIRPIIQRHCVSCHGSEKQKGDLRLDSPDWIRQGVRGKGVVLAGKPDQSGLYTLIIKPPGDEDRMPPKGDGVSKNDAELIKQWILKGADLGDGVSTSSGGEVKFAVDDLGASLPAPDPALLESLKKDGVVIKPVSKDGKVLEMVFSYAEYGPGAIKLDRLAPIVRNVFKLDLGRTKIVDDDLAHVAPMVNLTQLQLSRTGIGDAGIAHLKGLANLEFINLYQTKVTDAGLQHLGNLPKLKKVYTWQSMVTQAGASGLKAKIPGIDINTGAE